MVPDPRVALARRIYYGWIIVLACFLASVTVFGTTYAFGVFYDSFGRTFDVSHSLLAAVFGLQTALIYLTGVVAGRMVERHGQRRVACASGALLVGGLLWTSLARSYVELLAAFGIVAAVGMAGLYIVSYATLPAWFERRRGSATGIASAGLGVGLVVIPPGADAAISAFGWRTAMLCVAGVVSLLSLVVVLLFADEPAEVGADPGVEFDAPEARHTNGTGAPAGADARSLRSTLTSRSFGLVFLGWLLIFTPLYVILSHVVVHADAAGMGRSVGVLAIAVVGVATTVARFGIGALSDALGRVRTFVASAALLGASTIGIAVAPTATWLLPVAVVFGAGYGGCGGLIGAVTADLFGQRSLNTLFAVLSVSFAVAGLLAPPLSGLWYEWHGSYRLAFVVAGAIGIAGAGCTAFGARRRIHESGTSDAS